MEFFRAFVSKLEDAERSFVAIDGFLVIVCAPRRCLKTPDRLIVLCKIDIKTRQGWMPRDFGTGFVLRKRLFEVCLAKLLPDALTPPPAKAEVEAIHSGSTSILMLTWSDLQSALSTIKVSPAGSPPLLEPLDRA